LKYSGKEVQLKINILRAIHFIVSAWQQVTKSTIQNCFLKCGQVKKNEERSDVTEINGSGEDDSKQDKDWFRLGACTAGVNFDAYVSADMQLEAYGQLGSGSYVDKVESGGGGDNDDEAEPDVFSRHHRKRPRKHR
jgi:hypothetical protein